MGVAVILTRFSVWFRILAPPPSTPTWAHNLPSVVGMEEVVCLKIEKEVQAGHVIGPFTQLPIKNLQISPLGVVPKKTAGEYRLIHHLSYPAGSSVNDRIPEEFCSVKYATLDQAIHTVRSCGMGALMAKTDVQSTFRLLQNHLDFC